MIRIPSPTALTLATTWLVALSTGAAHADTVVQVPLLGLLEGRTVTTLTASKLVTFTLPTDGGGLQNAFATAAVALMQGAPVANALPNDGHFAADARHPEVVLHFSNDADAASPQALLVKPSGSFNFMMPAATYSKLFLFFNGAAGGTTIKVTLTYADGMEAKNATIPDYYADVSAADPVLFNLATNLAKWDKTSKINEANHHNITGAEFHPQAGKTLTAIQVDRGPNGNLIFWGATGVATSAVAGSGGAGGGGGTGSGGTGSGGAGSGGAPGTGAAGGTSAGAGGVGTGGANSAGAAGMNGGAGGLSSAGTGGTAGVAVNPGGGALNLPNSAANDTGCGCRLSTSERNGSRTQALWLLLGAVGLCELGRRRRGASRRK